jgi:hypothetical protein
VRTSLENGDFDCMIMTLTKNITFVHLAFRED